MVPGTLINLFFGAVSWLLQAGKDILQGLLNGIQEKFATLWYWWAGGGGYVGISGTLSGYFHGAIDWLFGWGINIITGLWNGIKDKFTDVIDWFKDLPNKIGDAIDWHSVPKWAVNMGIDVMKGVLEGLGSQAGSVESFFLNLFADPAREFKGLGELAKQYNIGSGVERWRNLALSALAYTGSPASWIDSLLRRMQQESGGNPGAINLWDSNARRGQPSQGLMQTIPSTFFRYAGELAYRGITDPFANIVASIRYANARYGSAPVGWNRPGGYEHGAWKILQDQLAYLHSGEMVVPRMFADVLRERGMSARSTGASFNFYGDVTFGSDMQTATSDLDFWSRVQLAGV